jgi:hypothetical protein
VVKLTHCAFLDPARTCTTEENRDTEELDLDAEATRLLPGLKGGERRVMKEGIAIQDFFLRTSTQLTYHGIVLLHQGLIFDSLPFPHDHLLM